MKSPAEFGPSPSRQSAWDTRAAVNFMAGGAGSGMIVVTAPEHADEAMRRLEAAGEQAFRIGGVVADAAGKVQIR